ncbi:uncharacterized protein N7477_004044 [Penicillium maclennaniae]|uniref:uncharacterized protein n=1 Tax=Penicillium maclennaniae TaxID=1343394 RepID=UPI002540E145|nr:uncharacterized protein N7477_004044 [Penicillium maclennaniae]KAJ5678411.1 hypothetical protein N7477_004044 [Penicillium maclennaniae]
MAETFLDTANVHREKQCETWLGERLVSRNNRDQMVIATKYTGYQDHHKGQIQDDFGGNGTKSTHVSLVASLRKLQTIYWTIHWWDDTVSVPELVHALNDLVTSREVLYLEVSDTPALMIA